MRTKLIPGVWIGAWKIVNPWGHGYFGAHHAAIALVDLGGQISISELLGWREENGGLAGRNRIRTDTAPEYGGHNLDAYNWVQIAPVTELARFSQAVFIARGHFEHRPYWIADSNRFIGDVLWHAHYTLTPEQRRALGGWVPSLVSPHIADFPG